MWFEIGILLALSIMKLQQIKKDHGEDLDSSCMMMLVEWSLTKSATWKKLLSVIDQVIPKIKSTVKPNIEPEVILTLDYFRTKGIHVSIYVCIIHLCHLAILPLFSICMIMFSVMLNT